MTEQIYIPLLDEGVNVWRPIQAEKVGPDTYRIPAHYNPASDGERWEFPPGATVVCQPRTTADGTILAAVRLVSPGRRAV
jgi:hypothetical protein